MAAMDLDGDKLEKLRTVLLQLQNQLETANSLSESGRTALYVWSSSSRRPHDKAHGEKFALIAGRKEELQIRQRDDL